MTTETQPVNDIQIARELNMFRYPKDMMTYGIYRVKKLMKLKNLTYRQAAAYHVAKERENLYEKTDNNM